MGFKFRDPGGPIKSCIEDHKAIIVSDDFGMSSGEHCAYRINEARRLKEELDEALDKADAWIEKHQEKKMSDEEILAHAGWEIECENPFEIRHEDGSFATLHAAQFILNELKYDRYGDDDA